MKEGTKIKIGTKTRILMPNGDINALSPNTGKILRRVMEYRDGDWYNERGNLAKFAPKDKKVLLKKLSALKKESKTPKTKTPKKVTPPTKTKVTKTPKTKVTKTPKTKVPKKTPKTKTPKPKDLPQPSPKSKVRVEELKGMTKMKVGNQFICTFDKFTFFLRKATPSQGNGWIIIEEQPDGSQSAVPGLFESPDSAMLYYKKIKEVSEKEIEKIKQHKGGRLIHKSDWKDGDRIVCNYKSTFRIGTITKVRYDWITKFPDQLDVIFDGEDTEYTYRASDPDIIGKGIPKKSKEPIAPSDINNWLVKESKSEKKNFSYFLAPDLNLPFSMEDYWDAFTKRVFTFIKDPIYTKMVKEYMLDNPIKIIEPDPRGGLMGTYWAMNNVVSINWKLVYKPDRASAITLVHEVIHYKLFPIKTKLRTFLKKNIVKILGLDPNDPKVKLWLSKFISDKFSMRKPPLSSARVKKLLNFSSNSDINYGLTNYFEVPSTYLALLAVGDNPGNEKIKKLAEIIYKEVEKQLKK